MAQLLVLINLVLKSVEAPLEAGVGRLFVLLSAEFLVLIGLAFQIATSRAWWAMHHWLAGSADRAPMGGIFALSGAAAVVMALATVSFQSWRAATSNPVKSLRAE